jgi:RimJ/RimL family protein N-acetyltransferase
MDLPATGDFKGDVALRDVIEEDVDIFFEQQLDPAANHMAAFTAKDPADRTAFNKHWTMILGNGAIAKKTILFDRQVAGHIAGFEQFGKRSVSYWIGREYWGKGIATRALMLFLDLEGTRPLYARAAKDNAASIRVLEKCGFRMFGEDKGYSNARGEEVEEYIFRLDAAERQK